jgi:hypothetical protein
LARNSACKICNPSAIAPARETDSRLSSSPAGRSSGSSAAVSASREAELYQSIAEYLLLGRKILVSNSDFAAAGKLHIAGKSDENHTQPCCRQFTPLLYIA